MLPSESPALTITFTVINIPPSAVPGSHGPGPLVLVRCSRCQRRACYPLRYCGGHLAELVYGELTAA